MLTFHNSFLTPTLYDLLRTMYSVRPVASKPIDCCTLLYTSIPTYGNEGRGGGHGKSNGCNDYVSLTNTMTRIDQLICGVSPKATICYHD